MNVVVKVNVRFPPSGRSHVLFPYVCYFSNYPNLTVHAKRVLSIKACLCTQNCFLKLKWGPSSSSSHSSITCASQPSVVQGTKPSWGENHPLSFLKTLVFGSGRRRFRISLLWAQRVSFSGREKNTREGSAKGLLSGCRKEKYAAKGSLSQKNQIRRTTCVTFCAYSHGHGVRA